jgi:hypothetical protein
MTDFSSFNPATASELLKELTKEAGAAAGRPIRNVKEVAAHLRLLARQSVATAEALAEGRIDRRTAEIVSAERKDVLVQVARFQALMAHVLAQRVADAAFRVIGWAIFNRTGVNLAPGLVRPEPGAG